MTINSINEPDLTDVIEGAIEDLLYSFNAHRVGVIESFNPDEQTATIQLVDKGVVTSVAGEELIDYPPLVDVPVIINKGIRGGLTIPISAGDTCTVHFNDRDLDNWLVDGLTQRPNTLRTHDFSDAVAEIGIRNQINKLIDYNNDATELSYLTNKISLDESKINLLNSSGGSIVIDDKLELKNTAESLKGIIDEFITIITNLKTVTPSLQELPIDGATASALTVLSTKVSDLLK
jgi:hypothetical protein